MKVIPAFLEQTDRTYRPDRQSEWKIGIVGGTTLFNGFSECFKAATATDVGYDNEMFRFQIKPVAIVTDIVDYLLATAQVFRSIIAFSGWRTGVAGPICFVGLSGLQAAARD